MSNLMMSGVELSSKQLTRSAGRGAKVVSWHRATFHGETLPRLRKLALSVWRTALTAKGVDQLALIRSYMELCEMRRCLLGFPSPGRRRDEADREARVRAASVVMDSPSPEDRRTDSAPESATGHGFEPGTGQPGQPGAEPLA